MNDPLDPDNDQFRCGYVGIVGRPNVGKSTLLNRLIGEKLSITSRKPQTTRHQILGINSLPDAQIIYVDTPGIHQSARRAINRYLNRSAEQVLQGVEVAVFVVEAKHWTDEDSLVLERLKEAGIPVIAAVNKIDRLRDKKDLLPILSELSGRFEFDEVIPVSARDGANVDAIETAVKARLPLAPPSFPDDQMTDRSERFLAAERVREKLFRKLGQEVPYGLTVEIEQFAELQRHTLINALIWVDRPTQKAIVIGKGGSLLKEVGQEARKDLEALFQRKIVLKLWVKVKEGWADDERALNSLGYNDTP